jgi:hypothetical protein
VIILKVKIIQGYVLQQQKVINSSNSPCDKPLCFRLIVPQFTQRENGSQIIHHL